MREQVVDLGLGMRLNAYDDIGEIVVGIHIVRNTRGDEGLKHGQILAGDIVSDEEIVGSSSFSVGSARK